MEKKVLFSKKQALVVSFFLLCGVFTKGFTRVNDASRFASIESIVEEGSLVIDESVFSGTMDKAFVRGNFYSDKPPGSAFLGSVPYFFLYNMGVSFETHRESAVFFVVLLTVGVFAAFLFGSLYDASKRFLEEDSKRLALALSLLATPFFPFATVLNGHVFAAALSFFSFLLLSEKKLSNKKLFSAGACLGLSVVFEYACLLCAIVLTLYAWHRLREAGRFSFFLFPLAFFGCVLGAYNMFFSGDPLLPSYRFVASWEGSPFAGGALYVEPAHGVGDVARFWDLLFDVNYGFFVFSPVAFLGVFAAWYAWRRGEARGLVAVAVLSLLAFLLFFTFRAPSPMGGCTFGSRHFIPVLPFWLLLVAVPLRDDPVLFSDLRFSHVFYAFLALGLFVNFAGAATDAWRCPFDGPVVFVALENFLFSPLKSFNKLNALFLGFFVFFALRRFLLPGSGEAFGKAREL